LLKVERDKRTGSYIDPNAGRKKFGDYVRTWLDSQTFDISTRNSVTWRLNAQILPFLRAPRARLNPATDIRTRIRDMQYRNIATSYQASCFAHTFSILSAAVDDS
jgi:hypothetical protein